MADQGNSYGAQIGVRVPTNWKTAYEQIAYDRTTAHEHVKVAHVARDALEFYLEHLEAEGELTEETRDVLDDDLLANAGGEGDLDVDTDADAGGGAS